MDDEVRDNRQEWTDRSEVRLSIERKSEKRFVREEVPWTVVGTKDGGIQTTNVMVIELTKLQKAIPLSLWNETTSKGSLLGFVHTVLQSRLPPCSQIFEFQL